MTWRVAKGNTCLLDSDGKTREPLQRHQALSPTSLVQNSSFIYQRPKTEGPPELSSRFLLLKTRGSRSSVVSVSLGLQVVEALQAGFKRS